MTKFIRARKGAGLITDNRHHAKKDMRVALLQGNGGIRAEKIKDYLVVVHDCSVVYLAIENQDEVGRRLRALASADEVNGGGVGSGVLLPDGTLEGAYHGRGVMGVTVDLGEAGHKGAADDCEFSGRKRFQGRMGGGGRPRDSIRLGHIGRDQTLLSFTFGG
jgi:hypothetical protein